MNEIEKTPSSKQSAGQAAVEVLLIFLVFFIFAGWPPPDVNEAHYLAKAKHYWDHDWCRGDLFLESGEAHLFFYWTFGWLTLFLPLPAVAWIGRLVTWGTLAWSWKRLSDALVPRPLMSVLTASLFLLFNASFHMAGEWVVGGVEAKGLAYVLVLLALEAMVRQRWRRVWILLGVATSLHVLVGGWSWVAAGVAWLSCGRFRPSLRSMWPAMAMGVLLALPGLAAGLMLGQGADSLTIRDANMIYVYRRLMHHLAFHRFPHLFIARHALLLILWLGICYLTPCKMSSCQLGQRPLRGFVAGAVSLAITGILIDQALLYRLDIAASLLKYYWYRLSDVFLAVGTAMALGLLVDRWWNERPRSAQWLLIALILISGIYLAGSNVVRRSDFRPGGDLQMLPQWPEDAVRTQRKYEDWRRVCDWIKTNTPDDAIFITPRNQQTFKWYAGRGEVFCWKDVPQDPASVVEWWKRQRQLYPRSVVHGGLSVLGETRLVELAHDFNAQYIVLDRDYSQRGLLLPQVYPGLAFENQSYEVYRVPAPAEEGL